MKDEHVRRHRRWRGRWQWRHKIAWEIWAFIAISVIALVSAFLYEIGA